MTDELKDTIEFLQSDLEMELTTEHVGAFLILTELIEKQEKRIKDLKAGNDLLSALNVALEEAMKKKDDALDALIKAASENQSELILLTCLDSAGVDNWEGYDFAFEVMKEHYPAEYERRFGEVT